MDLLLGGPRPILLAFVVLLYKTPAAIARECPSQSIAVGHLCISHVSTTKSSFGDAQKFCRDQDSALVLPLTQRQSQDLTSFGNTTTNDDTWINLNDQQVDSKFMMESGFDIDTEFFSNWAPGQPESTTTKNCVSLGLLNAQFYTDTCGNLKHFMCEKKKITCALPYIAHDNMCLTTLQPAERTINAAKLECEQIGGFLPHAFNANDSELFKSYVQSRFSLNGDTVWYGPMMGTRRLNSSSNIFVNPFNESAVLYTNWYPGEPNKLHEGCTTCRYDQSTLCSLIDFPCNLVSKSKMLFCQRAAQCTVSCPSNYILKSSVSTNCGIDGLISADFGDICERGTPSAAVVSGRTVIPDKPDIQIYHINNDKTYGQQLTASLFEAEVKSLLACTVECAYKKECKYAQYDKTTSLCKLFGGISDSSLALENNALFSTTTYIGIAG